MGLFDGLARGVGAAAQGYGVGQRQGEQEAYNRYKTQELLGLKHASLKPVKEDTPFPIKTLLATDQAVMGSGNPEHINAWITSGMHDRATTVGRAYMQGGKDAGALAYGITGAGAGEDTSSSMAQLARLGAPGTVQAATAANPSTPVSRLQAESAAPAENPYGYVKPTKVDVSQFHPGLLDTARAADLTANTARTLALTPEEVKNIQARTAHIPFEEDLSKRQFNLDAAQKDFSNALNAAKYRSELGFKDAAEQRQTWEDLLNASAKMYAHGGDPGSYLKPFLFRKGAFGQQTINPENAKRYLLTQGMSEADADAIVGGSSPGGLKVTNGASDIPAPNQGAMAGGNSPAITGEEKVFNTGGHTPADIEAWAQKKRSEGYTVRMVGSKAYYSKGKGAAPVLPRPTNDQGTGPGATTNAGLVGAENFAQGQGFNVTSTTGGQHNPGSLHPQGRALDVGVNGKSPVDQKRFIQEAKQAGYTVRDERVRPKGQAVWHGSHIHIEWGGAGPPADLPGMTGDQVMKAMNPGGDPNAGPNAAGINTPATAPKMENPWKNDPKSLESQVWEQVTGGRPATDILNDWKGTPQESIVQHVIESANTRQREGLFKGISVADRFGARAPEGTNFAGTLGYKDVGIPQVTTSPVEPSGGFGPGTPTPRAEMPSAPPPAPAAPPSRGTPISTQAVASPAAASRPAPAPSTPRIDLPAGPSLTGMPKGRAPSGPSVTRTPKGTPSGPPVAGIKTPAGPKDNTPDLSTTKQFKDLKNSVPKIEANAPGDQKKADQFMLRELSAYKGHEMAPGIQKWFSRHQISDPKVQLEVYKFAVEKLSQEVAKLPRGERAQKVFRLLEQRLKPKS